jgi:hypothetical protein
MVWASAAALLATVTVASAAHGSAPAQRTLTHTSQIVVRPVSWAGRVTPGFTVSRERGFSVRCSPVPIPSPGAVDPDILRCTPSLEDVAACWLSRVPHRTLCLRDPRKQHLVSLRLKGVMPQVLPYAAAKRGPLGLTLADGTYCGIRSSGSSPSLHGHPNYVVSYYCKDGEAIWAPSSATNYGVDRSQPVWTVRTAFTSGHGGLRTRNVAKAWFVGMHS